MSKHFPPLSDLVMSPCSLLSFPKHAVYIAEIIAMWSSIEDACIQLLPIFAGVNPQQIDLFMAAFVSSQNKMDAIVTAGRYALKHREDQLSELNDLFDKLGRRMTQRNRYAHAVYVKNQKGELCIMARKFEWPHDPRSSRVVHIGDLQNEMKEFGKLFKRLYEFRVRLLREMDEELKQALPKIWIQLIPPAPPSPE